MKTSNINYSTPQHGWTPHSQLEKTYGTKLTENSIQTQIIIGLNQGFNTGNGRQNYMYYSIKMGPYPCSDISLRAVISS